MKNNIPVPSADLLIRALYGEEQAEMDLLQFYSCYINRCASIPVCDEFGNRVGEYISDDLKQEIICKILTSLPLLKKKLIIRTNK